MNSEVTLAQDERLCSNCDISKLEISGEFANAVVPEKSKAMLKNMKSGEQTEISLGDEFLTNNLYCAVVNGMVRPEELMIRRIVNRYGATKIKLTEAIRMISPYLFT